MAGFEETLSSFRRPASPHEVDVRNIGSGVPLAIRPSQGNRKDVRSPGRKATGRAKLVVARSAEAVLEREMKEEPISVTDGDFIQGHHKDLMLGHRPEDLFRIFIEHRQRELLHDGFLPEIALGGGEVVESHLGGIVRKGRGRIHARCRHRISRNRRGVSDIVALFV